MILLWRLSDASRLAFFSWRFSFRFFEGAFLLLLPPLSLLATMPSNPVAGIATAPLSHFLRDAVEKSVPIDELVFSRSPREG